MYTIILSSVFVRAEELVHARGDHEARSHSLSTTNSVKRAILESLIPRLSVSFLLRADLTWIKFNGIYNSSIKFCLRNPTPEYVKAWIEKGVGEWMTVIKAEDQSVTTSVTFSCDKPDYYFVYHPGSGRPSSMQSVIDFYESINGQSSGYGMILHELGHALIGLDDTYQGADKGKEYEGNRPFPIADQPESIMSGVFWHGASSLTQDDIAGARESFRDFRKLMAQYPQMFKGTNSNSRPPSAVQKPSGWNTGSNTNPLLPSGQFPTGNVAGTNIAQPPPFPGEFPLKLTQPNYVGSNPRFAFNSKEIGEREVYIEDPRSHQGYKNFFMYDNPNGAQIKRIEFEKNWSEEAEAYILNFTSIAQKQGENEALNDRCVLVVPKNKSLNEALRADQRELLPSENPALG